METKKKIDILLISADYPPRMGGVSSHVSCLAQELSKITKTKFTRARVCKVNVLTGPEPPGSEPPHAAPRRMFLTVHHTPLETPFSSAGSVPLERAVRYVLSKWDSLKPDVIHAHDLESTYIGLMLKIARGVPLIVTVHKTPKEFDGSAAQRHPKETFMKFMKEYDFVDSFVAPSSTYQERLLELGIPDHKIRLIPHGICANKLRSQPNNFGVFARFDLERNADFLLCPSRIDKHKGLETFIEAASILKKNTQHRNLFFILAGSGEEKYQSDLYNFIERKGLTTSFRLGPLDGEGCDPAEMATLFRYAKACVVPSRREGFGLVILEAFAFRTPVVASNTGGIRDVIDPNHNGYLFNRDEADDLATQVENLLQQRKLTARYVKEASNLLDEKFSSGRMAEDHFNLYRDRKGNHKIKKAAEAALLVSVYSSHKHTFRLVNLPKIIHDPASISNSAEATTVTYNSFLT